MKKNAFCQNIQQTLIMLADGEELVSEFVLTYFFEVMSLL